MFLPIGDRPNPTRPAVVTWGLLIANVLVYVFVTLPRNRPLEDADLEDPALLQSLTEMKEHYPGGLPSHPTLYDVYVFDHGYKPAAGDLADLLYCMFLHGGLAHLFGNLLFLWIFGNNVEARLGRIGYLLAYLGTGAFATLSFAAFQRDSMVPLVGASGAISGVLGFYLVWFPRNEVKLMVWLFYFFMDVIYVRAVWVLLFYLVVENLLPAALGGSTTGVAYFAHIGGFIAGAALASFLDRFLPRLGDAEFREDRPLRNPRRPKHPWFSGAGPRRPPLERPAQQWRPEPPRDASVRYGDLEAARSDEAAAPSMAFTMDVERGDYPAAAVLFRTRIANGSSRPPAPHHVLELAEWLEQRGHGEDAESAYRYYLRTYPTAGQIARAHLGLGRLLAGPLGRNSSAREHLLTALDLAGPYSDVGLQARSILTHLESGS